MTERNDKDTKWRDKVFHESSKLQEGDGQKEGRRASKLPAVEALQQVFPDVEITTRNYQQYLTIYLETQRSEKEVTTEQDNKLPEEKSSNQDEEK